MPHPWALVDSSFPTLREGQRPQTQIAALVDYMTILTEALKYQLENLDTNNWNAAALTSFQLDTTKDVSEQVADVARQLKIVTDEVATIKNRLSAAENQLAYVEANGKVTLSPSVSSSGFLCKSHYFIRDNKIVWC